MPSHTRSNRAKGTISDLTESDHPSMMRIYREAFSEPPYGNNVTRRHILEKLDTARASPGFIGIVFRKRGTDEVIGFCWGMEVPHKNAVVLEMPPPIAEKTSYIANLAIDKRYRSMGVGSALVREYLRRAKILGAEFAAVGTHEKARAVEFYLSHGFELVRTEAGAYARSTRRPENVYFILDLTTAISSTLRV